MASKDGLFFCWCVVLLSIIPHYHQAQQSLIVQISDFKDFKKLLRTKTNLLVIFVQSEKAVSSSIPLFQDVAEEMKGKATLAILNCSDDKKLCKKFKSSPSTFELKHYKDGNFNRDYDRKLTVKSLVNFLLDPTGDLPWDEDPTAQDVFHIDSETMLNKILKKEKLPMLLMFYAPWCGYCKRLKPEYAAAATELKGQAVLAGIDVDKPQHLSVRAEYNITGFPTIYYFEKGKLKYKYGGENSKDGIVSWLKHPQAPQEPPKEVEWSAEESDVVHLQDDNFNEFLESHPSVLVMFYAPWCGHCKKMKPDYTTAAKRLKENNTVGVLAALDATKNSKTAEEYKIKGFPTVKYFKDGKFAFDFHERTEDKIVEFMNNPNEPPPPVPQESKWEDVKSDVIHLTEDTFKPVLKKKKHALVMFYAPWCGHCKKAKPEFTQAAEKFREDTKVAFAALDCTTQAAVCTAHEVSGYPTFKYFNYGKSSQKYMGGREEDDFVNFMKDPQNPSPVPTLPPSNPEADWADIPGHENIHLLDSANFDNFITQQPSVLVMFYAPWCGHCKVMKPAYAEAATKLKEEKVAAALAAIDATANPSQATKYEVSGYPTLKYFRNGKLAFEYSSGRKATDFIEFMKNPSSPAPTPSPEPAWSSEPSAVKHLTASNYTTELNKLDAALVMFYAPWCGHCKAAKPHYKEAAETLKSDSTRGFAAVDCTSEKEICSKVGVKGFPTFKLFIKGQLSGDYDGSRTKEGFIDFLKKAPAASVQKEEL